MNRPASERAVLACCLLDPGVLRWLELDAEDFADLRHRTVWEAMQGLTGDDIDADLVLLEDALTKAGKLDAVGGLSYLAELADSAVTTANVEHYAAELRTAALSRRVVDLAERLGRWVTAGIEGEELLNAIADAVGALDRSTPSRGMTLPDLVRKEARAIAAYFEALNSGGTSYPGVPTGIAKLDELTGGIPLGIPTVLGARPRVGKSTLALNIARTATAAGFGVHWFSNEDGSETFAQRWIATESGLAASDLRARRITTRDQFVRLSASERVLTQHRGLLWEQAAGQGAQWIVRRIQAEHIRNATRLVVVDLLARVRAPEANMSIRDRIGANLDILGACAARLNVGLLLLAHTKRESGEQPSEDDLAESDFLGRDGKLIILLRSAGDAHLDVWVVKNHQGAEGMTTCTFDKARCRIR